MPFDESLLARLRAIGLDGDGVGDAAATWRRLHERFGDRVTLVDRYALEAAARGVEPEELSAPDRTRLGREVADIKYPGLAFVPGNAGRGDPTVVVPYDPTWPAAFTSWRDRLASALGPAAVRIEHVGSTSVPGLAAKPIIDIHVSVGDVEDETMYVEPIDGCGVDFRSREPGHRYFRPAPGKPRAVHIHVSDAGSGWERDHLVFRDYLRAHDDRRDAYGRLNVELAARYRDDRLAYTDAETGFVLDTLDLAQPWAARTGWTLPPRRR